MPSVPDQDMPRAEDAVFHFVAVWLKDPGDAEARLQLTETTRAWRDFPGVLGVACGDALVPQRAIEQDFDFGVLMIFENEAALRAYLADPEHQRAVREVLAPAAAKVEVFDFAEPHRTALGARSDEMRARQRQHYSQFSN